MTRARSARPIWSAELGSVGAARMRSPARLVTQEQVLEHRPVESVAGLDRFGDGVHGRQLQHESHVAELEVGVHENDGLDRPLGPAPRPG